MNEKIMVVDDDELVLSGLAANLERAGFEVATASSMQSVRARVERQKLDLILCDLVLGNESGMDVLRYLQASHPDISVVIITGHGSVRNALEALKGGASDYIQKPADPEEVIHRIRMVLDSVNLRRALSEERHRAEERKRVVNEQLSRTERMSSLGVLADGAARDLKEILQPVEHVPDELRKGLDPLHDAQRGLIELGEALRKAQAVIRDLETIGRANNTKKSAIHINEMMAELLKSSDFRQLVGLNPMVKVETDLAADLPAVTGSILHVRQMLLNLITNAFEGMPTGGLLKIQTSIEHRAQASGRYGSQKPGDFLLIRFSDTAGRLSSEDAERIFEPFYVRNRLGRRILSGLGMTLVYRVVEDHGGYLDMPPSESSGNTLAVYLPVASAADYEVLELRPDYTGRERILLVEDSDAQRNEATRIMQEMGYEITAAASGYAALEQIKQRQELHPGQKPFDLMVIDLVLGDAFDGVETFKAAVELAPGLKAVLVSGFSDIARIVEARTLGISRVFQKPYLADTLGKNIRLALDES